MPLQTCTFSTSVKQQAVAQCEVLTAVFL